MPVLPLGIRVGYTRPAQFAISEPDIFSTSLREDSESAVSSTGILLYGVVGAKLSVALGAVSPTRGLANHRPPGITEFERRHIWKSITLSLSASSHLKKKCGDSILLLESKGVTVRGIDLDAFDDFIRQVIQQEETAVGLNTVFFPMHRVERIIVDEPSGSIPSLSQRFHAKVGTDHSGVSGDRRSAI